MPTRRIEVEHPQFHKVELVMTVVQAEVLKEILCHVGGDPSRSFRGLSEPILRALDSAGIKRAGHIRPNEGLYFDDYDNG